MVGRRVQGGLGDAAYGLDVGADLGRRQQAAVAGLGALAYLDEHAAGIGLHAGHGPEDAVPAEVAGGDLEDHVLELVALEQPLGHAAFAGAHAHGKPALLVEVGDRQHHRLPGPGGEGADGHVGEEEGIDPAHRRGGAVEHEAVAVHPEGEAVCLEHAAEGGAQVEGVALGVEGGVGHLGDAPDDDGVQAAPGVEAGAAAALGGAGKAPEQGRPGVGIAHRPDGAVGADLLAHAAARAGVGEIAALPDKGPCAVRPAAAAGAGEGLAAFGLVQPQDAGFDGAEGAGRNARAAQGAALHVVGYLPVEIAGRDVLGHSYCFHMRTSRSLPISTRSRSPG